MPNYFYTVTNGQKRGPINDQQLKVLAAQGIITPQTQLETESGHKGLAGQIPGLNFSSAAPSFQKAQSAINTTASFVRQASERKGLLSWLLDFSFRNIKLPVINLWFCRIVYVIYCVAAIIGLIVGTLAILYFALAEVGQGNLSGFFVILCVPLFWLVVAVCVAAARLCFEWEIIMIDWIIITTQAARRFLDNDKN